MDVDGNWLWAKKAGGTDDDRGYDFTIDTAGNIYVSGIFNGTATFGSHSLTGYDYNDIFVAKMDQNGVWQWATKAGGTGHDKGLAIKVDGAGNSYVTGYFNGTATFGSYSLTGYGSSDIFVAKMDQNGIWQWATKAGGVSWGDVGRGIAMDDESNCYVTGCFCETATFGLFSLTSSGDSDIFVAEIDQNGVWQWAEKAGGIGGDDGQGIILDGGGNCYVTGYFSETATFSSFSLASSGGTDIFVAQMNASGIWQWATQAGGISYDFSYGIALDGDANSYITGTFMTSATFGSYTLNSSGYSDVFVAKLASTFSADNEYISLNDINNFPNPFEHRTTINYTLKRETDVRLEVYNLKGQLVEILLEGNIQAGDHAIEWECQNIQTGVYFLKMKAGDEESVKKMVLMR